MNPVQFWCFFLQTRQICSSLCEDRSFMLLRCVLWVELLVTSELDWLNLRVYQWTTLFFTQLENRLKMNSSWHPILVTYPPWILSSDCLEVEQIYFNSNLNNLAKLKFKAIYLKSIVTSLYLQNLLLTVWPIKIIMDLLSMQERFMVLWHEQER